MEQHDAAWHAWRDAAVSQRILIHIDAHHDLWWADEPDDITIANFISPALATGVVRQVFWVVPDPAWNAFGGRAAVARVVRRLARRYPEVGPVRVEHDRVSATLMGRPLVVGPLASLPRLDEPVLLDIDVDYLLIPRISTGKRDRHTPLPWCWPDQLLARLAASGVRSDLATIAYSVDGGFTPLRWKYLGDELAARLSNPAGSSAGWDLLKRGAIAALDADAAADGVFAEAGERLPTSAAPAFARAQLATREGRTADAARYYGTAVERDATYRTPYADEGFPALWDDDFTAAAAAFRRMLVLDPNDPFAALGMGLVSVAQQHWHDATRWLAVAVGDAACEIDARRAMGEFHAAHGHVPEAIAEYERSLLLALKGQTPVARHLLTNQPSTWLPDPDHSRVHARLAELYASLGKVDRAISGYQIAMVGRFDGPLMRARLAGWRARQGAWGAALGDSLRAVAALFGWRPRYDNSARMASRAATSIGSRLG